MPNGYDWLYSSVSGLYDWLQYCESILQPQKKEADSIHTWKYLHPEFRQRMTNLLNETEAIVKFLDTGYNEKIKPGIIEHNEAIPKAVREGLEQYARAGGITQSEAEERAEKSARRIRIDHEPIEALLRSVKETITAIRQQLENPR
jgi:hypothetical protein